jgi:hypothetical protein
MENRMLYRPNKKETKQLKNLNKAYDMIRKAFDLIIKNAPKNDGDISVYAFRATKNIDSIIRRTAELIQAEYVNREFKDIIKHFNDNKKGK